MDLPDLAGIPHCKEYGLRDFLNYHRRLLGKAGCEELEEHAKICQHCALLKDFSVELFSEQSMISLTLEEQFLFFKLAFSDAMPILREKLAADVYTSVRSRLIEDFSLENNARGVQNIERSRLLPKAAIILGISFLLITGLIIYFYTFPLKRSPNDLLVNEIQLSLEEPNKSINIPSNYRYKLIDEQINQYLSTLSEGKTDWMALNKAEQTAKEIKELFNDNYPLDLVKAYQEAKFDKPLEILNARVVLTSIETQNLQSQIKYALQHLSEVEKVFKTAQLAIELERVNIQYARFRTKLGEDIKPLFDNIFKAINNSKHIYSKAKILRWYGEFLSNNSRNDEAIDALNEGIQIGYKLGDPDTIFYCSMLKTTIYFVQNKNELVLKSGLETLKLKNSTNEASVQLFQVLGLSSHALGYSKVAEKILNNAIYNAERLNGRGYLIFTLCIMGLVKSDQGLTQEAETLFNRALQETGQMADEKSRLITEFSVFGYTAKFKLKKGDYLAAKQYYEKALVIAEQVNLSHEMQAAELRQGLGETLLKLGNKMKGEEEFQAACEIAAKTKDVGNQQLSFCPGDTCQINLK